MIPEKHEKVSCETNENVEKIRTFHIQDKILKRRDQCRRIVQDQLFELFFMLNSGDMVDYKVCKKNFNDFDRMARFFKKKQLFTHKPIILPPTESQGNLTILKEDFKLNGSSSEPKIDFVAPKMVELSDSLLKHNKKWTYIGEKPYREVMLKDMKSVATNFKRQYHRKVRAAKFYASEANKVRMVKVYKPLTEFTRDTRKAVNHCKYLAFMINKFWHEAIFIHQIRFHRSQLIELINLYKYSFDDIHQPISLMGMKNLAFLGASGCHLSSMKYKTQFIETSEAHDHITEKLTESRKRKMSPDTLHPIELFPGLPSEAAQYLAYGRDLASKLFPRNILVPNGHLFPLTLLKRTLWPYQMVGVEWLVNLFDSDVNGILIQGTELGDTVQIIAYLVSLAEHKHVWGPHLIVVPKVDMLRWYNDFQEWCPGLKVHLYYKPEVSLNRCTTDDSSGFHQVVITSYEFMGCRSQHLTNQKWCCLILGTGIIPDPRLNQILTKVVSERRVLITDSRPELMVSQFDLKDLLNFLLPHNLQSYDISGLKSSNVEMDKISSNKYIELLEPFILYRNLDDIKDQIPRMEEIFVECPMKLQQVNLYHNYLSETYMSLFGSKGPTNLQFINILIDLCCHPELCTPHLPKTPYVSPPLIQHVPLSLTFETFDFFKPLLFLPSEFDPAASALTSAKIFGGSDQLSFGLKVKDCLGKNTRYENTSTPQVVKNPNYCSCTYLCRCSLSIKNTLSGKILLNTPQMKQYYKTRLEYNVIRTLENSPPPLYGERTRNFFKLDDDWSWMRGFDMYNKLLDLVDYDYFRKFRCVLPSKTQTWPFVLHPSRLGLYLRTNCPIISPDWGHIFDKSGKLQRLDQLLAHITTKRSKIVIISQSLEILDMLEKYMCYRNLRYVRVDHTSAFEDHIILGDMFDKNISVNFLITTTITDAFDLNLSKADRFVLFDVEWRPNLRARLENYLKHACHNRKIYVYKLFAVGTIEEFLKETDLFGLINDKNLDAAKSAVEKITDLTLKKLLLAITEQKDLNFNQSDVFDSISRKAGRGKISDISQSILANCDLVSPIELFAMRQINMADLMVLRKKMTDHENIPLDSVDSLLTKWKKDRQIVEELQDLHLHSLPSDKIKKFDGFHAKELTKKVYK